MSTPLNPKIPNTSGERLWKMTGLDIDEYMDLFTLRNLFELGDTFPNPRAKAFELLERLDTDEPVSILALGQVVSNAFGLKGVKPFVWMDMNVRLAPKSKFYDISIVVLPHTSGLNRWYNDQDNLAMATEFMKATAQAVKLAADPMECPECGKITLQAQDIETTPDGKDFIKYECSECHHEENM